MGSRSVGGAGEGEADEAVLPSVLAGQSSACATESSAWAGCACGARCGVEAGCAAPAPRAR